MILITKTFKHLGRAFKKTSSNQLIIPVKGAQKGEYLIKKSFPSLIVILNLAKLVSYQSGSMKVILFFMMLLASCNQVERNGQSNSESKVSKCFLAVFDRDTAYVSLDFLGKNIEGKMRIEYGNGKDYNGILTGFTNGDTLVCKYDFQINNFDKWYRNPVALLKMDDKLIMGDGKVMIAWGAGVFDKSVPINYENSRFVFEETNCPIDEVLYFDSR